MMEAELEDHIGYEKHSHEVKETSNRRNGSYPKKLMSSYGEVEIDVLGIVKYLLNLV
jgi:transposase-like protein